MQTVLGFSPIRAGVAYLPLTAGFIVSASVSSQLIGRIGTRPLIVAGSLIAAGGLYWFSNIPLHGVYAHDILPGLLLVSIGGGGVFVGVTTAANAGVGADEAGLAAGLLNTSQQLGGSLGLAILTALATARTDDVLRTTATPNLGLALTDGFQRAFLVSSFIMVAAAVLAITARNARTPKASSDAQQAMPVAA
jgi:MFS family permease